MQSNRHLKMELTQVKAGVTRSEYSPGIVPLCQCCFCKLLAPVTPPSSSSGTGRIEILGL